MELNSVIDPWSALSSSIPEYRKKDRKKKRKYRITCGRCNRLMDLRGYFYICSNKKCRGKHKAHPDGKPTGVPADRETGKARLEAHRAFDRLWQSNKVTRPQAYAILRRIMGITIPEAHIGQFTINQCQHLVMKLQELGDKVYEPPYNISGFCPKI